MKTLKIKHLLVLGLAVTATAATGSAHAASAPTLQHVHLTTDPYAINICGWSGEGTQMAAPLPHSKRGAEGLL